MSGQYKNAMDTLYSLRLACEQCSPGVCYVPGIPAREMATAVRIAYDCMSRLRRTDARLVSLESAIRGMTINLGDLADLIVDEH